MPVTSLFRACEIPPATANFCFTRTYIAEEVIKWLGIRRLLSKQPTVQPVARRAERFWPPMMLTVKVCVARNRTPSRLGISAAKSV